MPILTVGSESNVIVAEGDLDKTAVTEENRVTLQLKPGQDYSLDLSKLQRFDSAGLAFIINLISRHRQSGGKIKLSNSPDKVLQLIELSELDNVIPLVVSD